MPEMPNWLESAVEVPAGREKSESTLSREKPVRVLMTLSSSLAIADRLGWVLNQPRLAARLRPLKAAGGVVVK